MGEAHYGQEWRTDEEPLPPDLLQFTKDKVKRDYPDATIVKEVVIGASDPRHWSLDCEQITPHTHIYLKWVGDV